jgi:hypothetical protein
MRDPAPKCVWRAIEEELYWHLKDMGDLLQSAGPDAVGAPLAFLYLLEAEAECAFLTTPQHA